MRRSIWVLEVKNGNGSWGRTSYFGRTKRIACDHEAGDRYMRKRGQEPPVQYRAVKYVPRDTPWWRFWA